MAPIIQWILKLHEKMCISDLDLYCPNKVIYISVQQNRGLLTFLGYIANWTMITNDSRAPLFSSLCLYASPSVLRLFCFISSRPFLYCNISNNFLSEYATMKSVCVVHSVNHHCIHNVRGPWTEGRARGGYRYYSVSRTYVTPVFC